MDTYIKYLVTQTVMDDGGCCETKLYLNQFKGWVSYPHEASMYATPHTAEQHVKDKSYVVEAHQFRGDRESGTLEHLGAAQGEVTSDRDSS